MGVQDFLLTLAPPQSPRTKLEQCEKIILATKIVIISWKSVYESVIPCPKKSVSCDCENEYKEDYPLHTLTKITNALKH